MELLLQAGIHLIKKVITFVIYGRSVQVFKACTLFYFFSAEFFFSQIFIRGEGFVPQISQIYTDILHHDFSSSDFTEESEAFLLIGLLTDFRGTLAAGQWLAPYICSCCFVTQISQMTQIFLRGDYFVPQISQIYTDFSLWGLFRPTDFTDIHRFFFVRIILSHRFHRYTQIFYGISVESLCPLSGGICTDRTGRLRENP